MKENISHQIDYTNMAHRKFQVKFLKICKMTDVWLEVGQFVLPKHLQLFVDNLTKHWPLSWFSNPMPSAAEIQENKRNEEKCKDKYAEEEGVVGQRLERITKRQWQRRANTSGQADLRFRCTSVDFCRKIIRLSNVWIIILTSQRKIVELAYFFSKFDDITHLRRK